MKFLELAKARYSVRKYKSDPIPNDLLMQILEAASLAPTANNAQAFKLIIIQSEIQKKKINNITDQLWVSTAPLIIAGVSETNKAWHREDGLNCGITDVAIVLDHISLATTDLGLGSCWIGGFNVEAAREFLKLPSGVEPVFFLTIGYPNDVPKEKERKPIEDLVRYNFW